MALYRVRSIISKYVHAIFSLQSNIVFDVFTILLYLCETNIITTAMDVLRKELDQIYSSQHLETEILDR